MTGAGPCAKCGTPAAPHAGPGQPASAAPPAPGGYGPPPYGPPSPAPGQQPGGYPPYGGSYSQPPGAYGPPAGGYSQQAGGYSQPAPGAYGYGTPHTAYGMFNTPQIPTPAGLNPAEAVKRVLSHYATFSGRASRSEYWWWTLVQFLALFVPTLVMILVNASTNTAPGEGPVGVLVGLWLLVVVLGTLVPTIAVNVRRLHDIGQSGWLYLLIFIPSIGGLVLLVLCALASQPVGNQYGLAPRGSKPPFQLQP